jgi:hypothetical protein
MREIRTVTTEKSKRDNITRAIAANDKKLNQARADLAHINAAIRIIALGKRPGCWGRQRAAGASPRRPQREQFKPRLAADHA